MRKDRQTTANGPKTAGNNTGTVAGACGAVPGLVASKLAVFIGE